MPNGLWYASGDYTTEKAVPSSAYSKGDVIVFTSTSSFSRVADLFPSGSTVAGIALSGSDQSINNFCEIIVPQPDTQFWISLNTALTSHVTPGQIGDLNFGTPNNRYFFTTSTTSARVVCIRGTREIDQSIQSKILGKLIYHAGNLALS